MVRCLHVTEKEGNSDPRPRGGGRPGGIRAMIRRMVALALAAFALWTLVIPGLTAARFAFLDDGLRGGDSGPSRFAIANHRKFTDRYAGYCRERIASGAAAKLSISDISGTEWPLFGSAFFLWATEALQDSYETHPELFDGEEPRDYASEGIEAATALILDPGHAQWVRTYWGDDYLERENCYYRMLVISALTVHRKLTGGNPEYLELLRNQTEGLAAELEAAPTGLIDDYPGQCYPGDVVAAVHAIHRARLELGIPDDGFVERMGEKLFRTSQLAPNGLPPYSADAASGRPGDHSRGCSNSYVIPFAVELWPERAPDLAGTYLDGFWEAGWFAAGFREFPREAGNASYFDVDAGPVVGGIGMSATSFGCAALRSTGADEQARVLGIETVVASWPLPNGVSFLPWLASDREHAPYLGQCAVLFQLTYPKVTNASPSSESLSIPGIVYLGLAAYFVVGGGLLAIAWRIWPRVRR